MNAQFEILKKPLIVAAVVVVARVVLERAGAPESLNNTLSVALLHTLLAPLYFAYLLARREPERPYAALFKSVALYVTLTRLMILPVYWAARFFHWPQRRFDGLWGPDVGNLEGYVIVPIVTALIWIVSSIVIGGGLGSMLLAFLRRRVPH